MCPMSKVRPNLSVPTPNGFFVPLDRTSYWYLGCPVEFSEQSTDVALVVAGTELLPNHLSDSGTGPDRAPEPVCLCAVPEELGDQALLGRGEFGRAARKSARPSRDRRCGHARANG